MKSRLHLEQVFCLCFIILSIVIFLSTYDFKAIVTGHTLGPKVFPRAVSIVMGGLSFLVLIRTFFTSNINTEETIKVQVIMTAIVAAFFLFLVNFTGAYIATFILPFAHHFAISDKRLSIHELKLALIIAIALTSFNYLVFHKLFDVPFPLGPFEEY